jgi:hypothetical protein
VEERRTKDHVLLTARTPEGVAYLVHVQNVGIGEGEEGKEKEGK